MILTIIFKDDTTLEMKCKRITNYEVSKTSLSIEIFSPINFRTETIELDQVKSYSMAQGIYSYDGNPILISGILNVLNNHLK